MIDVGGLAANALGVLGLALALATWSYASAEARRGGAKVASYLRALPYAPLLEGAAVMVLLALALTETRPWARVWWILCIGLLVWQLAQRARTHNKEQACPKT